MSKQPEHNATGTEVKNWGLGNIAASIAAVGAIAAFGMGFLSTAVEAGGKGHFATVEEVAAVNKVIEQLDAGSAKKADVEALRQKVDDLKDEVKGSREDMKDLKNLLIRKMGK